MPTPATAGGAQLPRSTAQLVGPRLDASVASVAAQPRPGSKDEFFVLCGDKARGAGSGFGSRAPRSSDRQSGGGLPRRPFEGSFCLAYFNFSQSGSVFFSLLLSQIYVSCSSDGRRSLAILHGGLQIITSFRMLHGEAALLRARAFPFSFSLFSLFFFPFSFSFSLFSFSFPISLSNPRILMRIQCIRMTCSAPLELSWMPEPTVTSNPPFPSSLA